MSCRVLKESKLLSTTKGKQERGESQCQQMPPTSTVWNLSSLVANVQWWPISSTWPGCDMGAVLPRDGKQPVGYAKLVARPEPIIYRCPISQLGTWRPSKRKLKAQGHTPTSFPGGLFSWQDVPVRECISSDSLIWPCFRITGSHGSFPTYRGLDSVLWCLENL